MCNTSQAGCATTSAMRRAGKMTTLRALKAGLLGSVLALYALAAPNSSQVTSVFHAVTPVGYDVLAIKPGSSVLTFFGLIECPELEGVQQIGEGAKARIIDAAGNALAFFPRSFSFRITASLQKPLLIEPTSELKTSQTPQNLLLKLRFRLRVYHGLEVREIEPDNVTMIGVPAQVHYDERVYRVTFAVNDLPVTDRCVLEVLSPEGKRITRFHFDLL